MRDWRKSRVKKNWFLLAVLVVFLIFYAYMISLVDMSNISNGLSAIGLFVSLITITITVSIYFYQANSSFEISILESKIQHCEKSIDKFYLPLLTLLSSQIDGVINFSKLEELKGYRYLARNEVLSRFDVFYTEYVKTKKLPIDMYNDFLDTVKCDIASKNRELIEFYKNDQ